MAEPPPPSDDGGLSCVFRDCDNNASCVFSSPFLSPLHFPPPPPPSTAAKSSQSHLAPFLISMVCILGISFLLLTTCTIILRYRFSNRRRNSTARIDESPIDDDDGDSVVDHPIWHIATVGLQQSVLDSITAFKYKKVDGLLIDGSDCSVCLTGFEDGDDLRLLPKCNHAFHISCIDTWLRSHKNCPLCRAPVVNDNYGAESVNQLSSGNLDGGQVGEIENLENNNGGSLPLEEGTGESSHQLPIEIKNREFRILSDLSENYRFRGKDEDGVEPIRRSISFNFVAASTIHRAISNVCTVGNEGCSTNTDLVVQEKKINIEKVSGLLMKSSSNIGDSLQKGPVSMKRSLSSSSKLFSFRKTKNQASILPL